MATQPEIYALPNTGSHTVQYIQSKRCTSPPPFPTPTPLFPLPTLYRCDNFPARNIAIRKVMKLTNFEQEAKRVLVFACGLDDGSHLPTALFSRVGICWRDDTGESVMQERCWVRGLRLGSGSLRMGGKGDLTPLRKHTQTSL